MGYGLWKAHHGIQKMDAQRDYDTVRTIAEKHNLQVFEPKGKHWHKIEDATAAMLKQEDFPADEQLQLFRGLSYYMTL